MKLAESIEPKELPAVGGQDARTSTSALPEKLASDDCCLSCLSFGCGSDASDLLPMSRGSKVLNTSDHEILLFSTCTPQNTFISLFEPSQEALADCMRSWVADCMLYLLRRGAARMRWLLNLHNKQDLNKAHLRVYPILCILNPLHEMLWLKLVCFGSQICRSWWGRGGGQGRRSPSWIARPAHNHYHVCNIQGCKSLSQSTNHKLLEQ